MMRNCDYVFGECTFKKATAKHMGADLLEIIIKKYPNCKYVASHMADDTRKYLKKLKLKNVIIPKDGEIFEI